MDPENQPTLTLKQKITYGAGAGTLLATLGLATPLVSHLEGRTLHAYLDTGGVPSICNGITKGVKVGQTKTNMECDELLRGELGKAIAVVYKDVKVPLSLHQRAGLASFVYNIGQGAFERSQMLKLLNMGKLADACDRTRLWVFVGKRDYRIAKNRCGGIVRRREIERAYCLQTDDAQGEPNGVQ